MCLCFAKERQPVLKAIAAALCTRHETGFGIEFDQCLSRQLIKQPGQADAALLGTLSGARVCGRAIAKSMRS